jgi:hypothetical protein
MRRRISRIIAVAGLIASAAAGAHHSFTAFDQTKTVTLTGTVKDWQWTNPHTWLYVLVTDASGKTQEWGIEGGSPQVVRGEQHLSRTIMKPGDKVQVTIHPRRDGSTGGSFVSVATADGKPLVADSVAQESK